MSISRLVPYCQLHRIRGYDEYLFGFLFMLVYDENKSFTQERKKNMRKEFWNKICASHLKAICKDCTCVYKHTRHVNAHSV